MGKRVSLSLCFNQFNLMAARDEGTCEHEGTDVDGNGGTHAITERTTGMRKLTMDKNG